MRLAREQSGATLVELLTVLILIGMLAGISVPAFFHHRDKARDAQAKAEVRAAQSAAIEVTAENDGRFDGPSGITIQNLESEDPGLAGVALTVPTVLPDTYTLRVQSETGNTFDVTEYANGSTDLTCASADDAGCPADGTWD